MLELSARTRAEHLARMAEGHLDVLVVGGGIVGAGVALDAASRGLSVGLVERHDFASGTSGRSSRLIHGGARYLQQAEFGLVYESLRERHRLLRIAPHLVRPMPFLLPAPKPVQRLAARFGLGLYDVLTLGRSIRRHRGVGEREVARLAPGLRRSMPGYLYWDCHTDDARLVIEIVRRAAAYGALVANRAEVVSLLGDGAVTGARVTDRAGGGELEVRARVTVNATGIWADRVHALSDDPAPPRLRPSKGIHLVFDRERLPVGATVLIPSLAGHGGLIFVVPWGPRVYVGTTDTPYDGPLESPSADAEDVELILASIDRSFPGRVTADDVLTSWAGVRALLDTGSGHTRDLSRRHAILSSPGLITVAGGKLTTFRLMAEELTDLACRALGRGRRSATASMPLGLTAPFDRAVDDAGNAVREAGLDPPVGRRLVQRYGDDWRDALALIREDPSLAEPVTEGLPVLRVELELARNREMALDEEDVLQRRTRLLSMGAAAPSR